MKGHLVKWLSLVGLDRLVGKPKRQPLLFSCFLVEGSRLSSPFQGESRYSTIQKKLTGLTIPRWIGSQSISCHSMASEASHTNGYQLFLSIILVISIHSIGSADRSLLINANASQQHERSNYRESQYNTLDGASNSGFQPPMRGICRLVHTNRGFRDFCQNLTTSSPSYNGNK